MSELSKIGILLTSLFSIFSLALFLEILYLLLCRRQTLTGNPAGKPTGFLPVFLRRKRQHSGRVEPSGAPSTTNNTAVESPEAADLEMDELIKLQNSRLLFTIKEEEEREGSIDWSSERSTSIGDHRRSTLVPGESTEKYPAAESVCSGDTTPFATPCGSPSFHTPSPSP